MTALGNKNHAGLVHGRDGTDGRSGKSRANIPVAYEISDSLKSVRIDYIDNRIDYIHIVYVYAHVCVHTII